MWQVDMVFWLQTIIPSYEVIDNGITGFDYNWEKMGQKLPELCF